MSDFDQGSLRHWLGERLPHFGDITMLEKFSGGQSNPTYRMDTAAGAYVLRRKPFGPLLRSAHAVDREFRLLSALHPTGFPVPRPIALCEDEGVIGAAFYIMELVDGQTFWDGTLPDVPRPWRRSYYEAMVDTLAALHTIDVDAVGLSSFGRPGHYIERQVKQWTDRYRATQTDDIPEVEKLIEWLPTAIPEQTGRALIHGDFRIDNLIYETDVPRVLAVLDWELATIGDPLADFTYFAMHWAMPADGQSALSGVDLHAKGLPSLDDMVARYCRATGRTGIPNLQWYFAFNLFRLVGIVQGVKKRIIDGTASSAHAAVTAARVLPLARAAWAQASTAAA